MYVVNKKLDNNNKRKFDYWKKTSEFYCAVSYVYGDFYT